jgi:glycosyltransferase involved in cell wall biosynthesis
MRVLLASSASHVPPRGGSTRSNLAWLEMLTAKGHACRVVGGALSTDTPEKIAQVRRELEDQEIDRAPLQIFSIADPAKRIAILKEQIQNFQPDWVLVSSEDIGQGLLHAAHEAAPGRVIYLGHTPQFYPFGPESWNPDGESAKLLSQSAAIVAIGRHTADYIRRHLSRHVEVVHPPIYGSGPFALYGNFETGSITTVNPCAVKGVSIFLALAESLPGQSFAALPGWGTTPEDLRSLRAHPNISLLRNCKNIDQVLKNTRILLVPSLWFEGFGLIVVEAMLRGIPVVASDAGGLVDAKLGTDFVIPVCPIERYEPVYDDQGLPQAVLPRQDLTPWTAALQALVSDRDLYLRESAAARQAATKFVDRLQPERLQELLLSLTPHSPGTAPEDPLARLSPQKRALLLQRLRTRSIK